MVSTVLTSSVEPRFGYYRAVGDCELDVSVELVVLLVLLDSLT